MPDRVALVVRSDPQIANDDIVGIDAEIPFDRDSISGSGLSGDGDVIVPDSHISIDCSRHLEDDDSRPLGITCRLKAARSRGVQIGHRNHCARHDLRWSLPPYPSAPGNAGRSLAETDPAATCESTTANIPISSVFMSDLRRHWGFVHCGPLAKVFVSSPQLLLVIHESGKT